MMMLKDDVYFFCLYQKYRVFIIYRDEERETMVCIKRGRETKARRGDGEYGRLYDGAGGA